jgi:thiol-disulfide isomerase/thioredoxin
MKNNQEKFEDVIILKIDVDKLTNKRPQAYYDIQNIYEWSIKSVPTVIVDDGKKVLSGEDAFNWLDSVINKLPDYKPSNLNVNEEFSNVGQDSSILSEQEMKMMNSKVFTDKKSIAKNYEMMMASRQESQPDSGRPTRSLSPPIKI